MTLRAGASGFLCKSVGVDALPRALRCAKDGEAVVSRALTMRLIEGMRRVREDGSGMRPIRSPLTPREWEVLDLLCQESSTDEIADSLVALGRDRPLAHQERPSQARRALAPRGRQGRVRPALRARPGRHGRGVSSSAPAYSGAEADLDAYAAQAAHQLGEAVALLRGYLVVLEQRGERDPELGDALRGLSAGTERAQRFVDDLLDLAAAGRTEPAAELVAARRGARRRAPAAGRRARGRRDRGARRRPAGRARRSRARRAPARPSAARRPRGGRPQRRGRGRRGRRHGPRRPARRRSARLGGPVRALRARSRPRTAGGRRRRAHRQPPAGRARTAAPSRSARSPTARRS